MYQITNRKVNQKKQISYNGNIIKNYFSVQCLTLEHFNNNAQVYDQDLNYDAKN
jgi:hypothetical protein